MRPVQSALISLAVIAAVCCGDDRGGPSSPSAVSAAGTTTAATGYLDALLEIMRASSINTATIDWGSVRAEVLSAAGAARTIPDAYPAIGVALRLLNDTQSYYMGRDGRTTIGPPPVGGCGAAAPATPRLPETIAYVKVGMCDCQGSAATQFAESIQRAIREADRVGLDGWIVDLRGNLGGNMWPMIAGVGPVLGEGIIGYIVYNNREYEREYHAGAAQSFGEVFAQVGAPYTLLREDPKVAVLTDGAVASAAEAVAVYFKARPGTRSFGTPTCGHHHLQQGFPLSDGATLFLAVSQHADRTKTRYGRPIDPDEVIADTGEAFSRAIEWLQRGR